jgi:hypothetical protein
MGKTYRGLSKKDKKKIIKKNKKRRREVDVLVKKNKAIPEQG